MNPWEATFLDRCRSILRFGLWLTIVVNGLMLALFSVLFLGSFLWRSWGWCWHELFSGSWAHS